MSREYTFRFTNQVGVWRVARVAPKKEALVIDQLKPSMFEVYSPTVAMTRRVNGRGKTEVVQRRVLPGYLFIRNLCPKSTPLSQIIGINDVLPYACSPGVIDVARRVAVQVAKELAQTQPPKVFEVFAPPVSPTPVSYAPGDQIETLDGLLRGIFLGVTPEKRIAALCLMFGTERMIDLSPENVRPSLS